MINQPKTRQTNAATPAARSSAKLGLAALGTCLALHAAAQTPDLNEVLARLDTLNTRVNTLSEENAALREQLGAGARSTTTAVTTANVSSLRLGAELRLRYEYFHGTNAAFADRDHLAFRLRAGGVATLAGGLDLGFRLTNGTVGGDAVGQNGSKKAFALDLAYARWSPLKNADTSLLLTAGKMASPLASSDLVLDGDYTPEGVAVQFSHRLNERHTFKANGGLFALDQLSTSSHDPLFGAAQVRLDSTWSERWSSTFGLTALDISNASRLTNTAVPDGQKGNTRNSAGALVNRYHPWVIDAGITRIVHGLPVRVCGDYMVNPGANTDNKAYYVGLYVGHAAQKGTWDFNYRYRVAQADCWYEELIHPDSGAYYQTAPTGGAAGYGGGTNVRGHIFAATYALTNNATIGFTYFATHLIKPSPAGSESGMGRLQIDTNVKF